MHYNLGFLDKVEHGAMILSPVTSSKRDLHKVACQEKVMMVNDTMYTFFGTDGLSRKEYSLISIPGPNSSSGSSFNMIFTCRQCIFLSIDIPYYSINDKLSAENLSK